jgi:dUTP pyrophosphatase
MESKDMKLKYKKLHPDAIEPQYATAGAACFDLHLIEDAGTLSSGSAIVCGTGLSFEIPEGYVMLVFSRSGHGFKHGVRLTNGTGVIDSDYRGEVKVALRMESGKEGTLPLCKGDRVAQAMILPIPAVTLVEAHELSETERGFGGFGSTGV